MLKTEVEFIIYICENEQRLNGNMCPHDLEWCVQDFITCGFFKNPLLC